MALSIPGRHFLLSDLLVYFNASPQIIRLVSSPTCSFIHFKLVHFSGEYEETISRSFVQSAALKNLILKTGTPEVIQNCEPIFRKFIDPQIRNILVTDILWLSDPALDDEDETLAPTGLKSISHLSDSLKDCILKHLGHLPTSASTLPALTVAGIAYSVASKHSGNSCILLDSPSKAVFLPAQIEHIIQFVSNNDLSSMNTFVAV